MSKVRFIKLVVDSLLLHAIPNRRFIQLFPLLNYDGIGMSVQWLLLHVTSLCSKLILERIYLVWVILTADVVFDLKDVLVHLIYRQINHLVLDIDQFLSSDMLLLTDRLRSNSFSGSFAARSRDIIVDSSLGAIGTH